MNVLELRTEPLPHVRIALVGLGSRGLKTLQRYRYIRHASIVALADLEDAKLQEAERLLRESGRAVAKAYCGEEAWREVCEAEEVDLVYICTDWGSHTRIALQALAHGKHVALEVPAALNVEDCFALVEAAERYRRHCFMTENCCYDNFTLASLEMARRGLFGKINHCEGAYVHQFGEDFAPWMKDFYAQHGGNPYPTHGLGPIAWLLGIHRGDRMERLTSMTSADGFINNTLIRTVKGRTILLHLDVTTPRPYSRLQTICGTEGFAQKYPIPTLRTTSSSDTLTGEEALALSRHYFSGDAAERWQKGHELGVPNEMNYAMDSRLIHCLRNGLPLDIDVYDAAEWSCITELSQRSARAGGMPVEVPDFTRGAWDVLKEHRFW